MIGRLSGRIDLRGTDHVLLDVGGVGYVVHVSDRTLAVLPGVGEAASLWTDLLVREDLLQLFGFATLTEREWHRLLMTVQGIGAKASMAILGTLGPDGVARAVALGDWAQVKAAPGVGPKIAQRVVNELKGKAPAMMALADPGNGAGKGARTTPPAAGPASDEVAQGSGSAVTGGRAAAEAQAAAQAEALSALGNLGYAPMEAAAAVAQAATEDPDAATAALIRMALRRLAPAG